MRENLQLIIVPIIVALLGSSLWAGLIDVIKSKKKKLTTEQKMLLGLGHSILYTKLENYIEQGYVTVDQLEDLTYLYTPYKDMGGNGTCERLYEEVCRLPHKKEDGDK